MSRYSKDPFQLRVKYAGLCATCGAKLPKGVNAYYWPSSRKLYCLACGENDYSQFLQSAADEEWYQSQYR